MPEHIADAAQRRALGHPTRHRITLVLRTPMTVSAWPGSYE
ncbi:MAG: hypothetical protein V9G19_01365 [Tetrasphaera sp.]